VPGFEPGAADVPVYQSRASRHPGHNGGQPAERQERSAAPRGKPVPRDSLFDAPYVPRDVVPVEDTPAPTRRPPRKQVAALFRSPVKPDSSGQ